MGIHDPDLDTAVRGIVAFGLESEKRTKVDHASNSETDDDTAAATLRLHHGNDEFLPGLFEVGITRHGLDLVWDIVML